MSTAKVFISHASRNFRAADDLRARLEELDIPCWIAPRDIPAGSSYGEEITGAIQTAVAVILILTEEANASRGVASELELAFRFQRVIIPVRLRPVEPSSGLAFYVNNTQWVDACYTPLKQRVQEIARILNAVAAGSKPPLPAPEQWTLLGAAERRIEGLIRYKFLTLTLGFAVLAGAGVAGVLLSGKTLSRVENMATQFEALRVAATVISNPTRPEEFYSNAIQYEMRGDIANARDSYRRYFETGAQFIDPIERYVRLLNVTEGRARVAEVLKGINRSHPSTLVEAYIHAMEPPSQAAKLLTSLSQSNPDIGPLLFLLARQFSEERLGRQSLDEQKHEREALQAFIASHGRGNVVRFFIDQRMSSDWIASSEATLRKLAGVESVTASVEVSPANSGWQLTLNANEPIRRAFYRLKAGQELIDLGQLREIDPDTREPTARTFVELPRRVDLGSIEFFYDDLSRVRRGPVKLAPKLTDPVIATATWQREILETTKTNWVAVRGEAPIAYFTHLASYRCAIREVRWGWGESLNQTLKLPPCDVTKPFEVPQDDSFMVRFDPQTVAAKTLSVQLTYFDGTTSERTSIDLPSGVLEVLQAQSREAARAEQENSRVAARFDRFYHLLGVFRGAYGVAFKSNDSFWDASRLESVGRCFPNPISIAEPRRYDQIHKRGAEEGERLARNQASPQLLAQLIARSCDDARKAQKEAGP